MEEYEKAPFLHELVNSLRLSKNSQLLFGVYGNWGYSLSPLDLDNKLNNLCIKRIIKRGRARKRQDIHYYNFFSDAFDQDIHIMSRKENDCGYEVYLEELYKFPEINEAVHLALIRFQQIAEKLEALHFNKVALVEKYDDTDQLIDIIDEDIKSLSISGYKLAKSTKYFFKLTKQQLILQDITEVRSQSLKGLSSFSESLEQVKRTQFNTIEEATMATINALEGLKETINK